MFTPLPFPISSFILIVCFTCLSRAPLGINSSCLSAPGYQHTWGCRERDSVNVHTVYLRHYPAITLPDPLFPHCLLFIPLCICDFSVFYQTLIMLLAVSCKERKRYINYSEGEVLGTSNKRTSRCLSLSLRSMHDSNTLLPLWFASLIDIYMQTRRQANVQANVVFIYNSIFSLLI